MLCHDKSTEQIDNERVGIEDREREREREGQIGAVRLSHHFTARGARLFAIDGVREVCPTGAECVPRRTAYQGDEQRAGGITFAGFSLRRHVSNLGWEN